MARRRLSLPLLALGLALGIAGLALAVYFFWFARD